MSSYLSYIFYFNSIIVLQLHFFFIFEDRETASKFIVHFSSEIDNVKNVNRLWFVVTLSGYEPPGVLHVKEKKILYSCCSYYKIQLSLSHPRTEDLHSLSSHFA